MVAAVALTLAVAQPRWIGTWEAAPAGSVSVAPIKDETLRQVVHTSIGGGIVRVRFSNTFGDTPLQITSASVAVRGNGAAAAARPTPLRFDGSPAATVAVGTQRWSDGATLRVAPDSDLLVTLYVRDSQSANTIHPMSLQTNYFAFGNHAEDVSGAAFKATGDNDGWLDLSGVDVAQTDATGAVVAFGDSITDGWQSLANRNQRWPNVLARRLLRSSPSRPLAVLDAGISGNRILLDGGTAGVRATARFERDAVAQSGVRDAIVLLGINDIQQHPHQNDPRKIEAGLRNLVQQAHRHGLHIFGGTIIPYGGFGEYTAAGEAARRAVNAWIRRGGVFDGYVDFDRVVRDPRDLHRMRPAFDCGDHLHPNTLGLRRMAEAIDLSML